MASGKRCHYEVLGLSRDCTADEIRSAYKKLALQRHPDKLIQSGLSQADATAQFQELVHAYEILSDPKERAWFDSHRSQILFSDPNSPNASPVPNLYSYFSNTVFSGYSDSGKGFYKVYSDLFNKIYSNEVNFARQLGLGSEVVREAPIMGNLDSPYEQVTSFYGYWLGFSTVMDFGWVDEYDAMAGLNRKSRRVMEEENKKLRKKARREYNETVRGLAEFVKKRDKRVVDMMVKKNLENERKRAEESERRKKLEREKLERARAFEEPQWAQVEEEDIEIEEELETSEAKELYCVVCRKKFKSEKQWKNHEQSKKHREKVAELRESFTQFEEEEKEERKEETRDDDNVKELGEQFRENVGIEDENESSEDEENVDYSNVRNVKGVGNSIGSDDDDEMGVLEAMLSGHKSRRNAASTRHAEESSAEIRVEDDAGEEEFMEYDNRKSTKRNRGGKRAKSKCKRTDKEATRLDIPEVDLQNEETNGHDSSQMEETNGHMEESSSHAFVENESNGKGDEHFAKSHKKSNQAVDKKGNTKKEVDAKSKNSSKGRKGKATSKNSSTVCETCGEDFESRNRLHKHLGDTGHSSLKYR